MAYVSLTLEVAVKQNEALQDALHALKTTGLEVRDGSALPMPGQQQPKKGAALIVAYFENRPQATKAWKAVQQAFPQVKGALEKVEDRDWSTEWRSRIRPVQVGRLWVGPPWEKANAPKGKTQLIIEPKMAFGTGDHPTTSLCLAAVDDFMKAHPKASVLDVGTGSGVLAFAAKKLGAGKVVGTDNDPLSIELAHENAEVNGIEGVALSTQTLGQVKGTFDLVLANILANTLVMLSPLIALKVKKHLVLAGVLVPQREEVEAAFVAQGLKPAGHVVQGEWVRLDFEAGK
ncbi:MAG: 50S ribosomal protein L11 methyltransferase [Myxococcaceae bacterium]|nr:50S ribosomal protein L11 methyltransferase [Myxococcaceae bacterium]